MSLERVNVPPPVIVVAALSARPLAQSARQGGWQVVALDLFGDRDTRRCCLHWQRIGDPSTLRIDPEAFLQGLREAATLPGVVGWVPGGGFEQATELLDVGAAVLPRLGLDTRTVHRIRDVASFFGTLDRHALPHPPVSFLPPSPPDGWLAKQARGSGGTHVRPAAVVMDRLASGAGVLDDDLYFQREQGGRPMSALFVADGERAVIVALNRLFVHANGPHRYVYAGAAGPQRDVAIEARIAAALSCLVPEFGLRGLASLDFIVDEAGACWLLEINARPSSTMALHADAWPGGLLRAHLDALQGRLPAAAPRRRPGVRASRIVFAEGECEVDAALSDALAASPRCHDVPPPGTRLVRGEPVCTVSAEGASDDDAQRVLQARAALVLERLAPQAPPARGAAALSRVT
jgi:predicted ATP-grasp superfamily ATP-dependent carboligase